MSAWYVAQVKRDDAGALWNAVRWVGGARMEASITPTHEQAAAQKFVDELNLAEEKAWEGQDVRECPGCRRVMSWREQREQGVCNDCMKPEAA